MRILLSYRQSSKIDGIFQSFLPHTYLSCERNFTAVPFMLENIQLKEFTDSNHASFGNEH